jgi:acyl-CoA reductase-like NAD-dependent aldehyde dehydrogenase
VNDTPSGLSASIFTSSSRCAASFARSVMVGNININVPTTGLDPHVPFGGLKESGMGPKELEATVLRFFASESTLATADGISGLAWLEA